VRQLHIYGVDECVDDNRRVTGAMFETESPKAGVQRELEGHLHDRSIMFKSLQLYFDTPEEDWLAELSKDEERELRTFVPILMCNSAPASTT